MMRFWRRLFGLCEHDWRHATNIMTWSGPMQGKICNKCQQMKWLRWR